MAGTGNSTKKSLNVIIVGCGKVGSTLVEQLRHEGNDVTIIDKNSEKVQTLANTYDVMGVIGTEPASAHSLKPESIRPIFLLRLPIRMNLIFYVAR